MHKINLHIFLDTLDGYERKFGGGLRRENKLKIKMKK